MIDEWALLDAVAAGVTTHDRRGRMLRVDCAARDVLDVPVAEMCSIEFGSR